MQDALKAVQRFTVEHILALAGVFVLANCFVNSYQAGFGFKIIYVLARFINI